MSEHLQVTLSERGFASLPEMPSTYGGGIRVYESSAAMEPMLWIAARSPEDMNDWAAQKEGYEGEWHEAHVHMTLENAVKFAEQIMALAEDHYQLTPAVS